MAASKSRDKPAGDLPVQRLGHTLLGKMGILLPTDGMLSRFGLEMPFSRKSTTGRYRSVLVKTGQPRGETELTESCKLIFHNIEEYEGKMRARLEVRHKSTTYCTGYAVIEAGGVRRVVTDEGCLVRIEFDGTTAIAKVERKPSKPRLNVSDIRTIENLDDRIGGWDYSIKANGPMGERNLCFSDRTTRRRLDHQIGLFNIDGYSIRIYGLYGGSLNQDNETYLVYSIGDHKETERREGHIPHGKQQTIEVEGRFKITIQSAEGKASLFAEDSERARKMDAERQEELNSLLLDAAKRGETELARQFLDEGAEVDCLDSGLWSPLMFAAREGRIETARLLLDRGAEVNIEDETGRNPLMLTAHNGHTEMAELLLEQGADIDIRDDNEWTPLMFAAREGQIETARLLLECGADTDARSSDGTSALYLATWNGHRDELKLLLDRGANPNIRTNDEWTPLMVAARENYIEIAEILLEMGAEVNAKNSDNWTPLDLAAHNGHAGMTELLLRNGALNNANRQGMTPLRWASANGHVRTAELLLDEEERLEIGEDEKLEALVEACTNGHLEVVMLLEKRGANIAAVSRLGKTPAQIASEKGHEEIAKFLERMIIRNTGFLHAAENGDTEELEKMLGAGIRVDVKDRKGYTALMYASESGDAETVKLLLGRGANTGAKNEYGQTPAMLACRKGRGPAVAALARGGADFVHSRCNGNSTVLMYACEGPHPGIVEFVLACGAEVGAVDRHGTTALHCASIGGNVHTIRKLLDGGAEVNAKDIWNLTPLKVSAREGHIDAANMLIENGADLKRDGGDALINAAGAGHAKLVEVLLDKGVDVNSKSEDKTEKWTAIALAYNNRNLEGDHAEVIDLLARRKATLKGIPILKRPGLWVKRLAA